MIWKWDKERMTTMVQQAIRLWKKARGILLEKGGKQDFGWSDHIESSVCLTVWAK